MMLHYTSLCAQWATSKTTRPGQRSNAPCISSRGICATANASSSGGPRPPACMRRDSCFVIAKEALRAYVNARMVPVATGNMLRHMESA
eukprot:2582039-Amphidinium_carterae.1